MPATPRPRLNAVAVPIVGEFLLGMSVAMGGLWLASHTSDAAAGTFGLSIQVLETLFVLFRVLAIGVGVVTTQALGGQQHEVARRTALVGLGASTWAGALAALCVLFGNEATLDVLNAPDEILPLAAPYLQLLAPALVLEAYNLTMASILRAHLHARESLQIMVVMHGTHLLLAIPLMLGIEYGGFDWDGMGLYGYALALTASRGLGLLMHLWFWKRLMALEPTGRDWWDVPLPFLKPVLRIGLPGAAVELVYRVAFMVSLATTAKLGVAALATHSYTLQTLKYVLLVSMSIGWACEIMVGRLVGSGDLRTAHQLVTKGLRNGFLASGGLAVVAALGAPWLMRAFTRDPAIIAAAQQLLFIAIALETGRAFNLIVNGALRAAGDVIYPVAAAIASLVLVLGVGSYYMGRAFGLPGIFIAYAADEWIRGLLMQARWAWLGWVPHARNTQRRVRWRR
jgi:putative MATE family efflux protein